MEPPSLWSAARVEKRYPQNVQTDAMKSATREVRSARTEQPGTGRCEGAFVGATSTCWSGGGRHDPWLGRSQRATFPLLYARVPPTCPHLSDSDGREIRTSARSRGRRRCACTAGGAALSAIAKPAGGVAAPYARELASSLW